MCLWRDLSLSRLFPVALEGLSFFTTTFVKSELQLSGRQQFCFCLYLASLVLVFPSLYDMQKVCQMETNS